MGNGTPAAARPGGWKGSVAVGGVALLIGVALVLKVVSGSGWDITVLASFGVEEPSTLTYAEDRLPEVAARESVGHDGRFFFIQGNDPFLLKPSDNAAILDRPTYRSQRMLYPLLAGLGGAASPTGVVWGLMVVNLVALGGGAAALARYAQSYGRSPWFGLAFPLNPGLMSELTLDGAGVVAFAFTCGAVLLMSTGRRGWSILLLTCSALSREVMLTAAFGAAVWLWRQGAKRSATWHAAVPLASVGLWAAYVRLRIPGPETFEVQEIGLPFQGIVGAFGTWIHNPTHLTTGVAVLLCLVLFTFQLARGRSDALAYTSAGFVLVAVLLTQQVWEASFDMTRAVAPVLSALIVNPLLFSRGNVTAPADAT